MKRGKTSYIFILLLFIFAGMLSWRLYFKVYWQKDTVDIHSFPRTIGNWNSEEIKLTKLELEILETDNVFVRKYTSPEGAEVYLYVVYSQNNRKVSHPPEICYTGGGATILNSHQETLDVGQPGKPQAISTIHFLVEWREIQQDVFYWFKVGDTFTSNYWKQQGLIALKSFLGKPSSSAMIRLSANIPPGDTKKSIEDINSFARLIIPYLKQYLP